MHREEHVLHLRRDTMKKKYINSHPGKAGTWLMESEVGESKKRLGLTVHSENCVKYISITHEYVTQSFCIL